MIHSSTHFLMVYMLCCISGSCMAIYNALLACLVACIVGELSCGCGFGGPALYNIIKIID